MASASAHRTCLTYTRVHSIKLCGRTAPASAESCDKPALTSLDTLSDDVLLEIFAFCVSCTDDDLPSRMWSWKTLVQVCKQWRDIIYASPNYLDLYFYLSNRDNVEETIDSWPEFPLIVVFCVPDKHKDDADNLRDALAQRDRIRSIDISTTPLGENWFAELMEEEFPQLTHLDLTVDSSAIHNSMTTPYIFLDRFLGESAPSLQHLCIDNFRHGGLSSLLSSTPNLVSLQIKNIRLAGYMSPEEMVGVLAKLTKLRDLCIAFPSVILPTDDEFPDAKKIPSPHSPTHAVLPVLTKLRFEGKSEYFENLINLIDAPLLKDLYVQYLMPDNSKDEDDKIKAGDLSRFIGRTETFKHAQFRRVQVILGWNDTYIIFDLPQGDSECQQLEACLFHRMFGQENVFNTFRVANTVSHVIKWLRQLVITGMLSDVQHLVFQSYAIIFNEERQDQVLGCVDWLLLLHLFSAVEVLYVSWSLAKHIPSALEDAPEEMAAQVLPALQLLALNTCNNQDKKERGRPVERFLSLRKQFGCPVVMVESHNEFIERLKPHQLELCEDCRFRV